EPVVQLVNIPAADLALRQERTSFVEYNLRSAVPGLSRILYFVPCVEGVLFKDEPLLEDVFGRPLTDVERARAEYDPVRVLTEMAAERGLSMDGVWRRITAHGPDVVRTAPPVPDLIDFVRRTLSPQAAAVPA